MSEDLKNAVPATAQERVLGQVGPQPVARSAGLTTLDIGCGTGGLVKRLAALGHTAFGIEPQALAEQTPKHEPPKDTGAGTILRGGGEDLPFEDAYFDLVTFCHAFHHIPPGLMAQALAEAGRVLKPGATLMVIEPLAIGPFYRIMQPIDDEAPLYDAALKTLSGLQSGHPAHLQHSARTYIYSEPAYRRFEQLKTGLLRADPARAKAPLAAWAECTKRFYDTPKSRLSEERVLKYYSHSDSFSRV